MKTILDQVKAAGSKSILIIGDIMLDEYTFGTVNRISPEAPVPVLKEEKKEWSLGGAANVALNCSHISFDVGLIGIINAQDQAGKHVCSILKENLLSLDGVVESTSRPTTCKKRIMAKNQQLMRVDSESNAPLTSQERETLYAKISKYLKPHSTVVISDYAKGVIDRDVIKTVQALCQERNCIILIDPKGPDFSKYTGSDYMKPNLKEFSEIRDNLKIDPALSLIDAAGAICKELKLKGIIVTMGEDGIQYVSANELVFVPSVKREVFDLTGAGDTVIAFLAVGLLSGLSMKDCLYLASKAAAVAISHLKTYSVSLDELIDRQLESSEKYFSSWAKLKIEIDWLKKSGKKIVFTNGCYDLLHMGHIHMLRESKKLGDILVVGLNTDESVQRLKGPSRPIKPLYERVAVMTALGFVDFVTQFDEDTPLELIKYLKPDVLAKGVDYKAQDVVGYKEVTAYGGEVIIIEWKNENSTTTFVNKLNQTQKTQAA